MLAAILSLMHCRNSWVCARCLSMQMHQKFFKNFPSYGLRFASSLQIKDPREECCAEGFPEQLLRTNFFCYRGSSDWPEEAGSWLLAVPETGPTLTGIKEGKGKSSAPKNTWIGLNLSEHLLGEFFYLFIYLFIFSWVSRILC